MEIWKDIHGYERMYAVSNYGRVKSLNRLGSDGRILPEKILKGGHFSNGYRFVALRKNGLNKSHLVHRLVALEFIENPSNHPVVNHIDGDKTNNHYSNLEWCTQSQNLKHAVDIGRVENQCKITRKVTVSRNEKAFTFETMKECAAFFGFKKGWLQNRIRKHGLVFEYNGFLIYVHVRRGFGDGTAIL